MMTEAMLEAKVRTTVNLDDELVERAMELSGIHERGALLREALRSFIHEQASRRLALLAGSQPDLEYIPRRRFE